MSVTRFRLRNFYLPNLGRFLIIFIFIKTIASQQHNEQSLSRARGPMRSRGFNSVQKRTSTGPQPRLVCPGKPPSSGYPPTVDSAEYHDMTSLCFDAGCYCKDDLTPSCSLNFDVDSGALGAMVDDLFHTFGPHCSDGWCFCTDGQQAYVPWRTSSSEEESQNSPMGGGSDRDNTPDTCKGPKESRKLSMCRVDADCCEDEGACEKSVVGKAVRDVLFGAIYAIGEVGSCVLGS